MSLPNPTCTIDGGSTPANVSGGATVTIALANTTGAIYWSVVATDTDDLNAAAAINATLSINSGAKTATFTSPSALGSAVLFQSTVGVRGLGLDANGYQNPALVTTFKVNVPLGGSLTVMTGNETFEQNAQAGWAANVNAAIRVASTGVVNTLTSNFTQPAVSSNVTVASSNTSNEQPGAYVYIQGAGYYLVVSVASGTSSVIQNTGAPGNVVGGTTVDSGVKIVPAGAQGAMGPAANAPVYFAALSTTSPTGSRQAQYIDGYSAVADGGEGWFQWSATSTATADGGRVVAVTRLSTGRWIRQSGPVFSVKFFGATGNGSTDDTTAIQAALTSFAAAFAAGTATSLYFPAGTYLVSSQLVLTGAQGARIFGDGKQQSVVLGTAGLHGQISMLRLIMCSLCTIEHIEFQSTASTTTIASGHPVAIGATSITVTTASPSGVPLVAGQIIGLKNINGKGGVVGANAEIVTIANTYAPGSTTVPLVTATRYPYLALSVVVCSVTLQVEYRQDLAIAGKNSTANVMRSVQLGSPSLNSCVATWGTTCASGSDDNNDLHKFFDVQSNNGGVAAFYIGHAQSLNHGFYGVDALGQMNTFEAAIGGSAVWKGGFNFPLGCSFEISGTQEETWHVSGVKDESPSRLLNIFGGSACVGARIAFECYDKKSGQTYRLTGSNFAISGATIVGTGSLFTKELAPITSSQMYVTFNDISAIAGVPFQVATITDDTHLTLMATTGQTTNSVQMAQALSPIMSAVAETFSVTVRDGIMNTGGDAGSNMIVVSDTNGANGAELHFLNTRAGIDRVSLNNTSWTNTSTWDSSPTVSYSGTSQEFSSGWGGVGTGGAGAQSGANMRAYNGQRFWQFGDFPGGSGTQTSGWLGVAGTLTNANQTWVGTGTYQQWYADDALYMVVRGSTAPGGVVFQASTAGILLGLPLQGQPGINGLEQAQTQLSAVSGSVALTSSQVANPQWIFYPASGSTLTLTGDVTYTVPAGNATWQIVTSDLALNSFTITFTDGTHSAVLSATNIRPVMSLLGNTIGTNRLALG